MRTAFLPVLAASLLLTFEVTASSYSIHITSNAAPRIEFGATRIVEAMKYVGIDSVIIRGAGESDPRREIEVATIGQPAFKLLIQSGQFGLKVGEPELEGFILATATNGGTGVDGADDSGTLYGCLELARRIRESHAVPTNLFFADAPKFALRGPCIGMQKPYILPGRHVYEYPYTPELFPFFYDKQFWNEYLDFLVENRFNTLYLWAGHPFASVVRVEEYPYAVEVPDDILRQNSEMLRFITQECDKRGIWLVQMFYNILVSKPFAQSNNIQTQLSAPTPLTADYTRKSIAKFVKQYPNVGLMVCLGEALQGTPNQLDWCTNVILPGVLDGMKAAGLKQEPPIVIRTHAMDAEAIIPAAVRIYTNIFTESKYNGESLTTWEPRGKQQAIHLAMSKLAPHEVNIHILSNLEPFRYGDQQFIQKCVQAARDRLGAAGLHLYPLCYWNWPDSADLADPPLKQWQRDWIWFEAWGRYTWNPDIPAAQDRAYWISRLTEFYGNSDAAEKILDAYNDSGECAPRLIRRFGITEGNRQTLSLGMTLDQLVKPDKYKALVDLWESQSPPGERLQEYAEKEWKHQSHEGETPPQIIREVLDYSDKAVKAADAAAPLVTSNQAEFGRLRNDTRCIQAMSRFYAAKANAALLVLRYNYSHDVHDMSEAARFLAESLRHYQTLAHLTESSYKFANAMQTSQRKIPVSGAAKGIGTNYHWTQLVGLYQKELEEFQAKLAGLSRQGSTVTSEAAREKGTGSSANPWPQAPFKLLSTNAETYTVKTGARVFTDRDFAIRNLAAELTGLTGIRFSDEDTKNGRYQPIEFEVSEPVCVLVGYFNSDQPGWLQVPNLETAAQADERGGIEPVLRNAAYFEGCPSVNLHAFRYGLGHQKLELIGKGSFVILGIVPQTVLFDSDAKGEGR